MQAQGRSAEYETRRAELEEEEKAFDAAAEEEERALDRVIAPDIVRDAESYRSADSGGSSTDSDLTRHLRELDLAWHDAAIDLME